MKKAVAKILLFLTLALFLAAPIPRAFADCSGTGNADAICNPLSGGVDTVPKLAVVIINFLLGTIGVLAVLFIIIGGFQYVTSAGNDESAKKGQRTITYAVIGLIAAILAFAIVQISVNTITTANPGLVGNTSNPAPNSTNSGSSPAIAPVVDNCDSVKGSNLNVIITPSVVSFGRDIRVEPTLDSPIPANCNYKVDIKIDINPEDNVHDQLFDEQAIDRQSVTLTINSPALNPPTLSANYGVTVTYQEVNGPSLIAQTTKTITITQPSAAPPIQPNPNAGP